MSAFSLKTLVLVSTVSAICFVTSGCAPAVLISGAMNATVTDQSILDKTASYFGVPTHEIVISAIDKSALSTSYKAVSNKKLYNCSIYYGEVTCKQPGA